MAKLCTNCGMELARDDARFCGICGTLVAAHPENAVLSQDAPQSSPSPVSRQGVPKEAGKRVLREQLAQLPPARPTKRESEAPPPWMERLDAPSPSRSVPERPRQVQGSSPHNALAVWAPPANDKKETSQEGLHSRLDEAEPTAVVGPTRGRELHVKVWTDEDVEEPLAEEHEDNAQGADAIEYMPTAPLAVKELAPEESPPAVQDIEQIDTSPLSAQTKIEKSEQREKAPRRSISDIDTARMPMSVAASPRPSPVSQSAAVQKAEQRPVPHAVTPTPAVQPLPRSATVVNGLRAGSKRTHRSQMLLVLVMVLVVITGLFGGIWLWQFQPFSVAPATQPQQRISDSTVGVSLLYPTGWLEHRDAKLATLRLNDSSNTAQWTIGKTNQNVTDSMQYLKAQAAQLGMTSIKEGQPLAFAGTTWQQLQGSVTQRGANYTATLLGAAHNGHLFLIVQQAPQAIYADEEASVFSAIRTSLQFS